MARISSRRTFLTAAAAGSVAAITTAGAHIALAAVDEPDPIFALIEAERLAQAVWDAALAEVDRIETKLREAGPDRAPTVKTGVSVMIVEELNDPSRTPDRMEKDLTSSNRNDIIVSYKTCGQAPFVMEANGRRITSFTEPAGTLEEALAAFDAQTAAVAAARECSGLAEAENASEAADTGAAEALDAVVACTPQTTAGLLALLDLVAERSDQISDLGPVLDGVRTFVVGRS